MSAWRTERKELHQDGVLDDVGVCLLVESSEESTLSQESTSWPAAVVTVIAALAAAGPAAAESVSGIDRMLCATQQVTLCAPFAECEAVSPLDWEVPTFVVVDVAARMLSTTTGAPGRPRLTPVRHLERIEGELFLQGVENKRAFSIIVVEETGEMTAVISTADLNLSINGVCTPLPVEKPGGG